MLLIVVKVAYGRLVTHWCPCQCCALFQVLDCPLDSGFGIHHDLVYDLELAHIPEAGSDRSLSYDQTALDLMKGIGIFAELTLLITERYANFVIFYYTELLAKVINHSDEAGS